MRKDIRLEDIRQEVNITWEDPQTDKLLIRRAERAAAILERAAQRPLDFEKDAYARQLLYDGVRYLMSDAYKEFMEDYADELLSLNLDAGKAGTADGASAEKTQI